jgi:hypothetical protein
MKKKKNKHGQLLRVTWKDHAGSAGWRDASDISIKHVSDCITVGYVVHETNNWIVLAQTHQVKDHDYHSNRMYIIKNCITKWERL